MTRKQAAPRSEAKWLIFRKSKYRPAAGISSPPPKPVSDSVCRDDLVMAAGTRGANIHEDICSVSLSTDKKKCCFISTVIFCFPWWKRGERTVIYSAFHGSVSDLKEVLPFPWETGGWTERTSATSVVLPSPHALYECHRCAHSSEPRSLRDSRRS